MPGIEIVLNKASDLLWSWPLIVLIFVTQHYNLSTKVGGLNAGVIQ